MADVQLEMKAWAQQQQQEHEQQQQQQQQQHEQQHEQQQPRMQHKTLLQQAKDKLVRSLPVFNSIDINDLKARGLALWIAAAHLALYLTVGLYFISTVTSREYGRKFLSPSADPGSVCEKIPVAVTGTYLADKSGIWQTNMAFDAGSPLYQLTLTGTKVTEEQYTRVMQNFTAQLQAYGSETTRLDIVGSQLAWSLFRASDDDAMMVLVSYAQLGQIFSSMRTDFATPVFFSVAGVCQNPLLSRPSFDPSTLLLTVTVPDHAMPTSEAPTPQPSAEPSPAPSPRPTAQTPSAAWSAPSKASVDSRGSSPIFYEFCPDQVAVANATFFLFDSPTHSFNVDLASAVTAFALNFGIIDTTSLTNFESGPYNAGGDVGVLLREKWIDDRYSQMRSVRCFSKSGFPRVCLGMYGSTYVYPMLYNIDEETGQASQCPRDAKFKKSNQNNFLQLALVFAKDALDASTIRAGWALQRMMQGSGPGGPSAVSSLISGLASGSGGPSAVSSLISGLAHTARTFTTTTTANSQYNAWRRGEAVGGVSSILPYSQFAASFKPLGPHISVVSFNLWYYGSTANINAQGVTLDSLATSFFNASNGNGGNYSAGFTMCTDTIFQPQALQQMALAPPVNVIQPYLSCHPTLSSAFVTAAGIAAANSALLSSIFLILAVFLTVQYFNNFGGDSSNRIVAPADKALRAAETEKMLLADSKKLFANDASLQAEVNDLTSKFEAVSSELAAIKALLTRQQVQELSQQWLNTADTPSQPQPQSQPRPVGIGAANALFGGENPLHRRGKPSGLPAARLSLTGVAPAPAPAEEQTNR